MTSTWLFNDINNLETQIIAQIDAATGTLRAMLNMYQSEPIHNAFLAAIARGVTLITIFDPHQEFLANPRLDELLDAGAHVYLDKHCASIQCEYLIKTNYQIITGRYLYSPVYATKYQADACFNLASTWYSLGLNHFNRHLAHSTPYEPTGL